MGWLGSLTALGTNTCQNCDISSPPRTFSSRINCTSKGIDSRKQQLQLFKYITVQCSDYRNLEGMLFTCISTSDPTGLYKIMDFSDTCQTCDISSTPRTFSSRINLTVPQKGSNQENNNSSSLSI